MLFLIDIIFNVFTTFIPLLLSMKALDTTIEFHLASYQFLLNYWLYYALLQYIQHQFVHRTAISYVVSCIKLWLFYGHNNNLCSLNHFFVSRGFRNYSNFKSYEDRMINPFFNRIIPSFKSLSVVLNKLGSKYLKPIDYQSEETSIDYYLARFFELLNNVLVALNGHKYEQKVKSPTHSPRHKRSSSKLSDEIKMKKVRSRSSSITSNKSNRSRVPTPGIGERLLRQSSPVPYPMGEYLDMAASVAEVPSKRKSSLGRRTKSNGDYELDASIRKFRQQQFEQQVYYNEQQQPYVKVDGMKVDPNSLKVVHEYLNGDKLPELGQFQS
ncbi:uncharacterized protein SPAPADRAFT_58389 [Spathaspora passalidarum NRRL Y-27907]|uniref:Uncharacterized protein n=1 Tax=Spathaspora passalidarum (strain NRRL Y-27907 / 11-Y1) TaxID=619300 RepID=G3AG55_SPAPN|nr:uncharacterized protein SPAPADRAFT_58389 [Spathaspora passalidarum NRRL Y-27907]EGW35194.1 hypothetical protein SPAPADRAFT_58389 [Spathaspora passalidarum NRRL Y-27907]